MQAWGERVGRGVRTNPLQAMAEVGVTALTGIPVKTLSQGVGELGARYLGNKTGFAPGFNNQVGAAQARTALQPNQPQLTYNPTAPGPVNPATMYAGAGGASSDLAAAGRAALNEKYPPMPAREPPPPQVSQTPAELARSAAAARITPPIRPEQQAILDSIRARAQASGAKYTPPTADTPTVAPVAPTELPPAAAPAVATSTLDQLRSRLTPQTPEQAAAVEAYNALSPAEKATQTRAENVAKKAPPGVSQMIVPNEPIVHANKAAFEKAGLFDTLASRAAAGSYREGNKIITVEPHQGPWPFPTKPPVYITAVDAATGERVPVGKNWTAADPQPVSSKVRDKLNKNK
jgi:hypothetical protein